MAIEPNQQGQPEKASLQGQQAGNKINGIVTVNDDNNPTPEERDAQIPNEQGTERLRSEGQSAREGKHSE
ncbi:MAG TPA: hypothetical protein VD794_07545 [Flavisolibacter sp.]|nr:hypothetical protein [Flavisolibacter sp.]